MTRGASVLAVRTAVVSLSQTVAKVGDLLVAILLVRLLSPSEWAAIALLLSIYTAATGFAAMSLPQGIPFLIRRSAAGERRGLAAQTMFLLAVSGALAAGIILAIRPLLAGGPFDLAPVLPGLAAAVLLEVPTLGTPQLLLAVERVGASALFTAGMALLRIGGVTLPFALGRGVAGAVLGLVAYAGVRLAISLLLVPLVTPPGPLGLDRRRVVSQLAYTAPLGASLLATSLNAQVGKWLVAALDPGNMGAYAIAATEVPLVPILAYASGAVLATRLVHAFHGGHLDQARGYWMASTSRVALVVIPVTLGLLLGAPQLLDILFGGRYPAAVLPFQICTVILLHRVADYGGLLRAAGDTGSLWRASGLLLAANVLLGLPLTAWFGMIGTAMGTLGANLVAWLYILGRIARTVGGDLRSSFPWGLYRRVLLAAIVAAGIAAWTSRMAPDGALAQLGFRWALFAGLFLGAVRGFGLARRLPAIPEDHSGFQPRAVAELEA